MNEILFFLCVITTFLGVIAFYRLFGKTGLIAWISFITIVGNIEVLKCVDIFTLALPLGNILFGSTFLVTDILSENHGPDESRKAIKVSFACMIASTILFQFGLYFQPNQSDFASPALETIFSFVPRITVASLISFYICNQFKIRLYEFIRRRTSRIWLRNNFATWIAQLCDSTIFTTLAFAGVYDTRTLLELILTTYIIKMVIAVCDTPFLYWARKIHAGADKAES